MIVDDFVSACAQSASGQSATLAVVDLAELSNTVPKVFRSFSESLSDMIADNEYRQVSTARSNTREFARSSAVDQIDLVHFALNIGNSEGKALAEAVRGAVKYNRTSSNMNNSYGLSIYFPYRRLSNVDKAIKTYSDIGIDESYSQCIREFASLETSGQVSSGGSGTNPYSSLFGNLDPYGFYGSSGSYGYGSYGSPYGGSTSSSGSSGSPYSGSTSSSAGSAGYSDSTELINALLGAFFGGDYSSMSSLGSGTNYLYGRSMSTEDTVSYLAENRFDASALSWTKNAAGEDVIALDESQWALVNDLELNVFVDDGEGYIDLGLDNIFAFDDNGQLLAPQEKTWLTINGRFVAYYHEYTTGTGAERVDTGYVPVLLNGERAELLLSFDSEGRGSVVGARYVYTDGQTDTVAKGVEALSDGDTLDFLCDYYGYDGSYENSYFLGEQMTVKGELKVEDSYLPAGLSTQMLYRFTDLYAQHYWSLPIG